MRSMIRSEQVRANGRRRQGSRDGFDEEGRLLDLGGYVLTKLTSPGPPGKFSVWGCALIITSPFGDPQAAMNGAHPKRLQLRPIGRLEATQTEREALPAVRTLRPMRSGQAYRITSPPARGVVTPALAEALEATVDRFARERGFTSDKPLEIRLARGFKAGSHGHGEGRAADIIAVGAKSLLDWKWEWDQATAAAEKVSDHEQRSLMMAAERKRNLGYSLYKALQEHGGWRVDPSGWRPYRGVMQLFGPWTATEGPWKAMKIKGPNPYQRQRLADQQWVFQAHQDHIHVAR